MRAGCKPLRQHQGIVMVLLQPRGHVRQGQQACKAPVLPPQRSRLPLCYTLTSILGGYAKVNYQSHHRFQTARVAYTISEAVIAWP